MDPVTILRQPITRAELAQAAAGGFGDMIKAVVDVARRRVAIGGELHADEEAALLEDGARQADLWGVNLYPGVADEGWIEYDSLINVRPSAGNRSRLVENAELRTTIAAIVAEWVRP